MSWRKWSKLQGLRASRVVSVSISASADPEPPRAQAATLQLHAFSLRVCARARVLTFVSLAFRSLDWVQVIHEGLSCEDEKKGK